MRTASLIVEVMDRLDREGGIVRGVAEGRAQAEVNRQAYEHEKKIQTGEVKKVGINCYAEEEEEERERGSRRVRAYLVDLLVSF